MLTRPEPEVADRCTEAVKPFRITLLVAVSALAWTGLAQAKELASFKVCGASGCNAVTSAPQLRLLMRALETQGEPVNTRVPAPAPFFRLEFTGKGDERGSPSFIQYYVPSRGAVALLGGPESWTWSSAGGLRDLYDRTARGVKPFGKPTFTRVTIGGKLASDPASYAQLFVLQRSVDEYPNEPDWIPIEFAAAQPTPWTTHASTIEYSPSTNVLWRGLEFIEVPDSLASNLEQGRPLAASSGGGFPWLLLGGLGGAALVLPIALILRRRR